MPTIQKPQLDHASFPWHEQSDKFQEELEAQRAQVLERSGFNREFGNSGGSPSANEEQEGAALILELSGVFSSRSHQDGRRLQAGEQNHRYAEVDKKGSVARF